MKKIERRGEHLCSVVYGSLPPESRTKQATMFNDESSEFDVLVASDAIGMGLNLNISRIIFSTLKKFDGVSTRELTIPEIKQIAGRAGRYKSKFPIGEVTCLDAEDLPLLHSSLESSSPDLKRAGLFPTFDLLSLYSRLQSTNKFYPILEQFLEKAKLSPDYFIADCKHILKVASIVDELPLGLHEKYIFCIRLTSGRRSFAQWTWMMISQPKVWYSLRRIMQKKVWFGSKKYLLPGHFKFPNLKEHLRNLNLFTRSLIFMSG